MALWLIYALLSALTAALVAVLGKIGLEDVDSTAATAVRAAIMAIFLIGFAAFQGKLSLAVGIVGQRRALAFIALSGAAGAASWLFYFLALKYGSVSQVAPIDKLSVVAAVVLAAAFLGEKISWTTGAGVALIAAGAVLVALK
ncbi:EamA family transporter [Paenibacillus sp.]|uniref:EamA family transporter n=1 Tax=Paenibacillus sp. TaxID=58172 RepID=UPI002D704BAE|nr:EamA family transporter [Paenibacillus sp.]HZG87101.1 EamA family transporter [Paenibacillus sp.]